MHPGAELIYGEEGRAVCDVPESESGLRAYVECGLLDLSTYLAERSENHA